MCSLTSVDAFYEALRARDVGELRAMMREDFVGHVSAGMPCGVGGRHDGADAMLRDVWMRVFADFDVTPVPDSTVAAADGSVVVHGWYEGRRRATGGAVRAEFVHLIRVEDDRLAELRQVTDTASW